MTECFPVAILGASGYVGAETLRLALGHPRLSVAALGAKRHAGRDPGDVHPRFRGQGLPRLEAIEALDPADFAAVFCCLPHGTTQEVVARMAGAVRIVDLSADFRLSDPALYEATYGLPHRAVDLQKDAVYGLTEHARTAIGEARLVACPGCYPTSVLLPLVPLLGARLIAPDTISVDAMSGVSGAGRTLREDLLYSEVAEGVRAYGLGGHRHIPEIEQTLARLTGEPAEVSFIPHLVPMNRGILSTIRVRMNGNATVDDLHACLAGAYAEEPFLQVLNPGEAPSTRDVRGSNRAVVAVAADRRDGGAIVFCAIDNLLKGAAGQAVQNLNCMLGLDETEGLTDSAMVP